MTNRASRIILMIAAFFAGLGVFLGIVLLVTGRSPTLLNPGAAAIGGAFELVDHNGQTITAQDMKGKPFLVFFGFTHCPDVCPTTLFEVSEILRTLGPDADKARALFVTVDPARDTPAVLKDYLSNFDPRVIGATGDADAISTVQKAYRVYAKKVPTDGNDYTMDHTALVYLMDKQGKFVAPFNVKRKPEAAAAELRRHL